MTTIKPIQLELNTAQQQAEYFFNREFNAVDLHLLGNPFEDYEICFPSDEVLINEMFEDGYYLDYEEQKTEFIEEYGEFDQDDFNEHISELREFQEFKDNIEHFPMWSTVWSCDRFYIDSDYCNIDKLYELGIGVLETEDKYYLFICGCGYSFYNQHWIPLFKMLNWIEEETETTT